jgi:pimeloyl-ACP methyl ester carboxylesterase
MRQSSELCAGDELVVLVRGTSSEAEWGYNLDYVMTRNANYGQGLLHRGFQKLADSLWAGQGGLKNVLDQNAGSVGSVTIAGHSLGAAAAALLAARAQVREG